ncbi:hypothetical protein HDU98_004229 [Podochytrium sp. JEL0797]|nr:hypothetical protein HDU98_004229 [Podochytrium sp. JEL0797]
MPPKKGQFASSITEAAKSISKLNTLFHSPTTTSTSPLRLQIAHRILESSSYLGSLYLLRGSIPESEYYFHQGLTLAKACASPGYVSRFLGWVAEVRCREDRVVESRRGLEGVNEGGLESVVERGAGAVRRGDLLVKEGKGEEALEVLEGVRRGVEEAMMGEGVDVVVKVAVKKAVGVGREKKGVAPVRERKVVRRVGKVAAAAAVVVQPPVVEVAPKYNGLAYLKTEVTSRIARILDRQDRPEEAERQLSLVAELPQRGLEEAEYLYTLSSIKFKKLWQSLNGNPLLEMFGDSAFSVPWCVPKPSTKPATTTTKPTSLSSRVKTKSQTPALERNVAHLDTLLTQTFHCAKLYGATWILYETCHSLALLNVIRAYLTGGVSESCANDLALSMAFYLDQANGITSKRELLGALSEKRTAETQDSLRTRYESEMKWTPGDLQVQVIDQIPSGWTVVSLSADPLLDDLYITRMTRGATPVTVRVPMKRQAIREGEEDGFGLEVVLREVQEIMEANDETTKVAGRIVAEKREQTREEKVEWWRARRELDGRLKGVLGHVEKYWLGGFKGLLLRDDFQNPLYSVPFSEFKTALEQLVTKSIARKTKVKPIPLDPELCCMILKLGSEPDSFDVEDVLYYLMDAYQYAGFQIGYDEINIDMLEGALSESVTRFHLSRTNINAKQSTNPFLEESAPREKPHLVLVLDKKLQSIPWESIPCIRGTSVSRVHSLCFLRDRFLEGEDVQKVTKEDAFYVLNPSKDLVGTEKEFTRFLKGNKQWDGVIGRAPTEKEMESNLSSKPVVMYFGHGGAEQYVRGHNIRKFDNCAVTFLMGCSSGKLSARGEFDVSGTALNYMMGRSPTIVANLWDVTDRDVDRFSKKMFCSLGMATEDMFPPEKRARKAVKRASEEDEEEDLEERRFYRDASTVVVAESDTLSVTEAVAVARDCCELGYMVGAAPVVEAETKGGFGITFRKKEMQRIRSLAAHLSKRNMTKFAYPAVRRDENHVDMLHGTAVKVRQLRSVSVHSAGLIESCDHHLTPVNRYRHLEDPDATETQAFVEAQNGLFQGFIKNSTVRPKLESKLTDMYNYERYGVPSKKGSNYYYFHNSGLQPQAVMYTQKSVDGEASVFFDPNTLSADGTTSLQTYSFSEKGNLFAYALSQSGSDWVKIHVKQVGSDKDLEEKPIEWAKFTSIEWTHDEKGFFYGRFPTPAVSHDKAGTETESAENQMIYYHRIGTDQSEDILVYKDAEHPTRMFSTGVSDCGRYLILSIGESCDPKNLVYYADLEKQFGGNSLLGIPKFTPIVDQWEAEYSILANEGTVFFFKTSKDAPKKRIVKFDIAQPELGFVQVVAETENPLDFVNVVDKNKLVLVYLKDVKHVMKVYDLLTGSFLNDIEMPPGSIIKGMSGNKKDTEMFYNFGSFLSPGITRRYEFASGKDTLFRETSVKGFDSSLFEVKQIFYASEDGTKIPMYIIHKKNAVLDGNNPTLLYAYGGFNISILPSFSVAWLTFIEKFNGVVAVANIRGGGEYGEEWYAAGRLFKKQNCFTDFQCAAKYLIASKYTQPSKLAINGGSNGGLLVGACLNQAPELFGLGIAEVGVMDLLRFHKFTIGSAWTSDYGNPDVAEDFENAFKISPVHNVPTGGAFPAVLIITGDHDDRVVPLHSMKLAATMQHNLGDSANPIMMRINTKAGHGAGKSMQQIIEEASDKYTYLSIVLNAAYSD